MNASISVIVTGWQPGWAAGLAAWLGSWAEQLSSWCRHAICSQQVLGEQVQGAKVTVPSLVFFKQNRLPSSSCKSQKGIRWYHSAGRQSWNPGRLSSSGKGFIDNTCAHIREQCLSAVVPQQLFSYRSTATSQHWRKLWKQRSQMQRPRTKVVSHVQHRVDLNSVTLDASEL